MNRSFNVLLAHHSLWLLPVVVALSIGWTAAGPGLSWDEPAYRHSQITLTEWIRHLGRAGSLPEVLALLSPDTIDRFFEFNRMGHNFHPPMASYLNILSASIASSVVDDLTARRFAGAVLLALTSLVVAWDTRYYTGSTAAAWVAGLAIGWMPRVVGDAHVIGTDVPGLFFWVASVWAFRHAGQSCGAGVAFVFFLVGGWLVKFPAILVVFPLLLYTLLHWVRFEGLRITIIRLLVLLLIASPALLFFLLLVVGGSQATWRVAEIDLYSGPISLAILALGGVFALVFGRYQLRVKVALRNCGFWSTWTATSVLFWPLAIFLNPSWWHLPLRSLSAYFDLTLRRQDYLPDIKIYYLSQQYLYTLPWENTFVLLAVTVPFGLLLLGGVGIVRTAFHVGDQQREVLPLLVLATFPIFRMLGTPCHDGVRLFLPTFASWAMFAGIGSWSLVGWVRPNHRGWAVAAVAAIGPGWTLYEWASIHPYELSYYNTGLPVASRLGFEQTYWYDAVTETVLRDMNEKIPSGQLLVSPDPLINPEVFSALQAMGRLKPGIELDASKILAMPYFYLLTHSSKATTFTQLLFAMKPLLENREAGTRLFAIVEPRQAALAWAFYCWLIIKDQTTMVPATVDRFPLSSSASTRTQLADLVIQHGPRAIEHLDRLADTEVRVLVRWRTSDTNNRFGQLDQQLVAEWPMEVLRRAGQYAATPPTETPDEADVAWRLASAWRARPRLNPFLERLLVLDPTALTDAAVQLEQAAPNLLEALDRIGYGDDRLLEPLIERRPMATPIRRTD